MTYPDLQETKPAVSNFDVGPMAGEPIAPPEDVKETLAILGFTSLDELCATYRQESLSTTYQLLYSHRPVRSIDELMTRTVGTYEPDEGVYKGMFEDPRRGKLVDSELYEFMKEVINTTRERSDHNLIELCFEAADVLFPLEGLQFRDGVDNHQVIAFAQQTFGIAFELLVKPKLQDLQVDLGLVQRLGRIKYAIRAHLQAKGYVGKHPKFEDLAAAHELQLWKQIPMVEKNADLAKMYGFESVSNMCSSLLQDADLRSLVKKMYGASFDDESLVSAEYRKRRGLRGDVGSIEARLFGVPSSSGLAETYKEYDGTERVTDWKQLENAKAEFKQSRTNENWVKVVRQASVFLWQYSVVNGLHTDSSDKQSLLLTIQVQLQAIREYLSSIHVSWPAFEDATRAVYASRQLVGKNPDLENELIYSAILRSP